jgi:hypothetical protein
VKRPLSSYSKAFGGGVLAALAAVANGLSDGEWTAKETLIAIGAFIAGALGVYRIRNTQTVETGAEPGPVTIAKVVSRTGAEVGTVVADTGAAAGGIVAGTTGVLGAVVDGTLGKLIPGGGRRG